MRLPAEKTHEAKACMRQNRTVDTAGSGAGSTDGNCAVRGRVVTLDAVVDDAVIGIEGTKITSVRTAADWAAANPGSALPDVVGTVLPGLVDIHCHGGSGGTFTTTDRTAIAAAAAHHHRNGTTTLLASLVSAPPDVLLDQLATLRPLVEDGTIDGIHLEGPFLSAQRCGAQDPRYLIEPDVDLTERLLAAGGGTIRAMTLAPELPGFTRVAQLLRANEVVVALGHSDASYNEFAAALGNDARLVTHLANGMAPLHHRTSGPVAAALVAAARHEVVVEVIGDGVHTDAGFVALVFAAARGSVALITDAMAAAGMPDGDYDLGPQRVRVIDGIARVASGSIAGGTATLLEVLRRTVVDSGVPLVDAVRAATATPATVVGIGERRGAVEVGYDADLVVVDSTFALQRVMRRGSWLP